MQQVDQFLSFLSSEKRYSKHTLIAYKTDLSQFRDFLLEEYEIQDPKEVSNQIVRSWLVHLFEKRISAKSISRKLSSLKSFYRYLKQGGMLEKDPSLNAIAPKIPKKLPVFVKNAEMEKLFELMEFEDSHAGIRSKLILEILYSCGIRLDELIGIQHSDIDVYRRSIKIHGKRNKERLVPVYPKVMQLIKEYSAAKERKGFLAEKYLLLTDKGQKLYPKLVYRTVHSHLSKVSSISKKSPHVLRHTFATHMLNNGADLNTIKEILGHSSLAATEVYTHNSMEKLKNVYKLAHPRA